MTHGPPRRGPSDSILFYADCNRCDSAYLRRIITFVNHVREPALAEVYVLITDEQTGSGGRRYALAFSGRERFEGQGFSMTHTALQSETQAQEREGLTHAIMLGLTSYGFYFDRVTEEWKVRLRPYFNPNARTIEREDRDDVSHRRHGFDSFLIRSLGDHWGAGVFGDYTTTTIDNIRHRATVTPAVEYSFVPYQEASYRAATLTYRMGYEYGDYFEETIYEQTEESLLAHSLDASVQARQSWGSVSTSLGGSSYLHDSDIYRLSFNGNVSLRVGQGLSVNFGGSYQRINDQLSLPRGDASLEDVLLERRRIATSYRGSGNIGLSYTFGSIFTSVVNPRF